MDWLRHSLTRIRMGFTWQRLLGSSVVTLATLILVDHRAIAAGQVDVPLMTAGFLGGYLVAYRAWPAIDFERWRRWKRPDH